MSERFLTRARVRKTALTTTVALLIGGMAEAQQATPYRDQESFPKPLELTQTPPSAAHTPLSDADASALKTALDAARRADIASARVAIAGLSDPIARRIATWALVDANSEQLSFFELDQARRDLAGWPRATRRQLAAEKLVETSGQSPAGIISWFGGTEPLTAEGAMALAAAWRASGQTQAATDLIRHFWRDKAFEAEPQRAMLTRFGDVLTQDDHVRRADVLLFGAQGPAARDLIPLLPGDQQQLALARIALRNNAASAGTLADALPASVALSPGLAFERAAWYRRRGSEALAYPLLRSFPTDIPTAEMGNRIWDERYQLTLLALRNGDAASAYAAAANSGLKAGASAAEAEFYAGWIALTRLKNPAQADQHFQALERIGSSPITRGRALYWRGRTAEALKAPEAADAFYGAAARYNTTFYGQLAAEKLGNGKLTLENDPAVTQADRARFEARPQVRAARILIESGNRDLFRTFVLSLDDILPTAEEEALLVDMARNYGEMDTSMKAARGAAQRGFVLTQRGYPIRMPPEIDGGAEVPLVLGITRQESGFDPKVRSGAGARGMMQLMPSTASILARKVGVAYSPGRLDDPDYNMQLGSAYLGGLVNTFSGSYVMAIAGYNAGPGRPTQWSGFCGDPRGATTDPIDFIECIPFSETRNYVMRVMEGMQVYRARLRGGEVQITLSADLKRGGYVYSPPAATAAVGAQPAAAATLPDQGR